MYRGTTPTLRFSLPFPATDIDNAYVTFAQYGTVKIDKPLSACTCEGDTLTVRLTQSETLALQCNCNVEMQISVKIGDNIMRSQIITTTVERILKEGEIV